MLKTLTYADIFDHLDCKQSEVHSHMWGWSLRQRVGNLGGWSGVLVIDNIMVWQMTCPLWGSSVQVDLCINHVVKSKDVRCGLSLGHEAWTWPCKNENFLGPSNERSWLCTGLCHSAVCAWAVCLSFGKVALGFLCWFPVLWHDHDRDCVHGLRHSAVCAWAMRLGLDHVTTNTFLDHPMKDYGRV